MNRILIIDDEFSMLRGIEFHLRENADFAILTASDRKTAMEILGSQEIHLVVTDLMLPSIEDGLTIMRFAKKQWYQPSVLAMTAFESVENAVATMQAGADDFVSKGFGLDELTLRINNLLKKKNEIDRLAIENRILRETIQKQFSDFQIIGKFRFDIQHIFNSTPDHCLGSTLVIQYKFTIFHHGIDTRY